MKLLIIDGAGIISAACSELALDLYLFSHRRSNRLSPPGTVIMNSGIRAPAVREVLSGHTFAVDPNRIAFAPQHGETDSVRFNSRARPMRCDKEYRSDE